MTLTLLCLCCCTARPSAARTSTPTRATSFSTHPRPSHVPANAPLPLPLATALSAPFSSQHCSFASTYYRHAQQLWRPCYTCNLIDANGCCSVCAVVCHAGHQLGEERISNFFCDCGSRGPGLCLCLPESPYHSHHSPSSGVQSAVDGAATAALAGSADLSGGLSVGNPNVDLSAVASGVLAANKLTFRCDDRPTLPERVRQLATQLLARDEKRRIRRREQRDSTEAEPNITAAQVRRANSFTLGALASCLDETEEEREEEKVAAAGELSPVLLAIGHYVSRQLPFSLRLTATERPLYDKVVQHYRRACSHRLTSGGGSGKRSLATIVESSLRLWLTVGGVDERLCAAAMLLDCHLAGVATLPASLASFFSSFTECTIRCQHRILRTSRTTHHTELSTTATVVSFDLFCSSLALVPPTPSTASLSPSSATAFSSITSASSAQQHGIYPSLSLSTDGSCLYFLSARYGLVRLGTGEGDTVAGELLAQNVELALHAGGHIACVRPQGAEEDTLLLRSPLLPPHSLFRVEPRSLTQLDEEVTLSGDETDTIASDEWNPFEIECEIISRTPSTSTTPHWQPLAPLLQSSSDFSSLSSDSYRLLKQTLSFNQWKLNDRCAFSASVHLTISASGIFLVVEQTGQLPNHYRLRIRTTHRPPPLLPDQRYVQKGETAPSRVASFSPVDGGMQMEVFTLVDSESGQIAGDDEYVVGENESVWKRSDRVLVRDYHHPLPVVQSNVPSTAASQPVANSPHGTLSSSLSPALPASGLRCCDGCGLVDWREEDEFVCVDGCINLRLCTWCQLHDRFNTATHSAEHHMDHRMPASLPPPPAPERRSFLSSELSGGVVFSDSDRLVLLPPPLPSSTLRHWRDFAVGDVVDVRDMYQKWSAGKHMWPAADCVVEVNASSICSPYCACLSVCHMRRYQADILAVNAADKSVLVHYQGWHTKWDEVGNQSLNHRYNRSHPRIVLMLILVLHFACVPHQWISTNTDRFAPRGSLSSQNKATGPESAGHKQDGTEGARRAVRQAARVLQLVQRGADDAAADGEQYDHCTDVVVRTRGQAFACLARTRQVWCIDEDGVMEVWNNDSKPTSVPQPTISHDQPINTLFAARSLIADCPVLSVKTDSVLKQLTLIRDLLRPLLEQDLATASAEVIPLLLALLGYLTRLVHRLQRELPFLTAEAHAVINDIRTLLQVPSSASLVQPESVQLTCMSALIAGLPLFFPTWERRFAFVTSLHIGLSSEHPAAQHEPCRLALVALGKAAYSSFAGSGAAIVPHAVDSALVHPVSIAQAVQLVTHLGLADQSWLSKRLLHRHVDTSGVVIPRRHVYLLVSYFSELYVSLQPTHFSPAAARSYSALTAADSRNLSGLLPFLTLSSAVMQIVRFTLQKLQRWEDETGSRPPGGAVLKALRSCALFHVLPPLLSWLPEALQLVASGAYEHYMQLDSVLHQLVPLMVDLARLLSPSDSSRPLSLPQLLASLREARQLTTLQSQQGVQHRTLTPFARQVFTGVFRRFATTQPDGNDKELTMNCDDFIRLYSHCHLPSTVAPQQSAATAASNASPPGAPPPTGIHTPSSNIVFVPIQSPSSPSPAAPPSAASASGRSSSSGSVLLAGRPTPNLANLRVIAISEGPSGASGSASSSSPSTSAVPVAVSFRDESYRSPLQSPSPPAPLR